ncbi:MAG: Ig-like domain-containing protein [Firmicutes bacterium]|nr:Ig-like domain-containing protein [Bacillota bacterium]
MKKNRVFALLLVFAMVLCLASCGGGKGGEIMTVTFDTDGGSAVEAQTTEKGNAILKPETPKKEGYIFDKWTLNGVEYEFGSAVTENITLKAVWVDPNAGNEGGSGGSGGSEGSGGSGGSEGSGSSGGSGGSESKPETVKVESLSWENNWYWVQELCYCQPVVYITPESARSQIVFSCSDTSIATVDKDGLIYGIKPGNVTITVKCGDKSDDLPLEVRPAPKPGISLSDEKIVLHYSNNETSNHLHPLTVSFNNGADPNSAVTWTSSDVNVAGVANGVVGANELGHAVITATTAEGYTASCEVYITGTALRVYHRNTGQPLGYGEHFEQYYTYELVLVEDSYYESGLSKQVNVSDQVVISAPWQISYSKQGDFGIMYFDSSIATGQDYTIQFSDPLNLVVSDLYKIYVD